MSAFGGTDDIDVDLFSPSSILPLPAPFRVLYNGLFVIVVERKNEKNLLHNFVKGQMIASDDLGDGGVGDCRCLSLVMMCWWMMMFRVLGLVVGHHQQHLQ